MVFAVITLPETLSHNTRVIFTSLYCTDVCRDVSKYYYNCEMVGIRVYYYYIPQRNAIRSPLDNVGFRARRLKYVSNPRENWRSIIVSFDSTKRYARRRNRCVSLQLCTQFELKSFEFNRKP